MAMNTSLLTEKSKLPIGQPLLSNERGSLSILGLTCFLMIFCLFFFYFYFQIGKITETKVHTRSLICLKKFVVNSNKYIKKIDSLNKIIIASNAAVLYPPTRIAAQASKKAAQLSQQAIHFSYMQKAVFRNRCQVQNKSQFYKNPLIKTKNLVLLYRNKAIGTTEWNKNWKITFLSFHKRKILDSISLDITNSKINLKRTQKRASALWNSSFGFL